VGRRYRAPHGAVLERAATLRELRARLQRAVEGEEFEQAASLRDQIRGLE
jgi:protein arginine kinase activator